MWHPSTDPVKATIRHPTSVQSHSSLPIDCCMLSQATYASQALSGGRASTASHSTSSITPKPIAIVWNIWPKHKLASYSHCAVIYKEHEIISHDWCLNQTVKVELKIVTMSPNQWTPHQCIKYPVTYKLKSLMISFDVYLKLPFMFVKINPMGEILWCNSEG